MSASDTHTPTPGDEDPLERFAHCHDGILRQLQALDGLPALAETAAQARRSAEQTLRFFRDVIYEHHGQEEQELFPAVLASAAPGEELAHVQRVVAQLTREHREIEAAWEALAPALKALTKGREAVLDADAVQALVRRYRDHAGFEEREFLPLSEAILGRNSHHMAALGLSLHLRHAVPEALERYPGVV